MVVSSRARPATTAVLSRLCCSFLLSAGASSRSVVAAFSTSQVRGPSRRGTLQRGLAGRLSDGRRPTGLLSSSPLLVRGGSSSLNGSVGPGEEGEDDEPRTGWLHNTEPKYYTPPTTSGGTSPSPAMRRLLQQKMNDYRNHRIIGPPAVHPCGEDKRRVLVTEHKVAVPLHHPDMEAAAASGASDSIAKVESIDTAFFGGGEALDGPTVDVYFSVLELVSNSDDERFARSLSDPSLSPRKRAELYLRRGPIDPSRAMLYLQGGPGFGCAAPVCGLSLASSKSSWAASALFGDVTNLDGKPFERVVLMDQRGTGRSSAITKQSLKRSFPDLFSLDGCDDAAGETAQLQLARAKVSRAAGDAAEHLALFRADSIVRDAEWIKSALVVGSSAAASGGEVLPDGEGSAPPPGPWGAALGQSFGGFCLMTYLSSIASPPSMCLFTGGIAPMNAPAREVYDRLWPRVRERSMRYYERYPGDVRAVKRIVRRLLMQESGGDPVLLPSGGVLTARRFLQLGLALGGSPGSAFANLHSVISSAFLDDDGDELSDAFLKRIDYEQSFDDAPLYYLLHESIYADGAAFGPTGWAAHSSYDAIASSDPAFDYRITSKSDDDAAPTLFFGEMVFPWMADGDFAGVSGHGMKSLSTALAEKSDWAPLYDESNMRSALRTVKAASATYYDDMYVDFDIAMGLLRRGAPLDGVRVWVTNEYQHSGLRDDGANIVCRLASMAKGACHVPS